MLKSLLNLERLRNAETTVRCCWHRQQCIAVPWQVVALLATWRAGHGVHGLPWQFKRGPAWPFFGGIFARLNLTRPITHSRSIQVSNHRSYGIFVAAHCAQVGLAFRWIWSYRDSGRSAGLEVPSGHSPAQKLLNSIFICIVLEFHDFSHDFTWFHMISHVS